MAPKSATNKRPAAVSKRPAALRASEGQRSCPIEGCGWKTEAQSTYACRQSLNRHLREEHSEGPHKRRRQEMQRMRLQHSRSSDDDHANCLALVVSPLHRDALYAKAVETLSDCGLPVARIRRRHGIDWLAYQRASEEGSRRPYDLPRGLKRHTFLMWDFHKSFLPAVAAAFEADDDLDLVFWVEDDIKIKDGVTWTEVVAACGDNPAPLTWLAYYKVKGRPRYGTHLLAVHRDGLSALLSHLDAMEAASTDRMDYLEGLDTFCFHLLEQDDGLVAVASQSLAEQRRHTMRGRR